MAGLGRALEDKENLPDTPAWGMGSRVRVRAHKRTRKRAGELEK